jgi:hypothetical protein
MTDVLPVVVTHDEGLAVVSPLFAPWYVTSTQYVPAAMVPPVEAAVTVGAVVGGVTGSPVTPDVGVREALKVGHVMFPVPLDVQPEGNTLGVPAPAPSALT